MKTRTTVTFDPDVAVEIDRLRRERRAGLKEVLNDLVRRGLRDAKAEPQRKRTPFRTKTSHMGPALIDIDNVAEALAYLEGENFK